MSSSFEEIEREVMDQIFSYGTDISLYENALNETVKEEERVRLEISNLLGDKNNEYARNAEKKYNNALDTVLKELPNLKKSVEAGVARLDKRISQTREMADDVSKKVRQLDVSRTRALQALEMVQSIVDLKECVKGVEKSINQQKLEEAADMIYVYREKERERASKFKDNEKQKLLTNEISEAILQVSGNQETLRICEGKLKDKVMTRLDTAVKNRDDDDVLKCCSILSKLRLEKEGIIRFMKYQCSLLRSEADMEIELSDAVGTQVFSRQESTDSKISDSENQSNSFKPKSYVDLLTYLFNKVAALLQQLSQIVKKKFGHSCFFQAIIISSLHAECDILACRVLSLFLNKRRVNERVQILLTKAKSKEDMNRNLHRAVTLGLSVYDADQTDEMLALDSMLDELVLMSQHTVSYDRYIKAKRDEIMASISDDDISKLDSAQLIPDENEYDRIVQEIAGIYAIMEENFIGHAVNRAIEQEVIQFSEKIVAGSPEEIGHAKEDDSVCTTSVVPDVFYILQKCSQRALATGNVDSACATVNNAVKILEEELSSFVKSRCENLPSEATTLSQQGQAHFERIRDTVMTDTTENNSDKALLNSPSAILNSCSICLEYTKELQEQIEEEAEEILSSDAEKTKLKSCTDSLVESANLFARILDHALNRFTSTMKSPIQSQISASIGAASTTFDITEEDFERLQAVDPNIPPLLTIIDEVLEVINEVNDIVGKGLVERVATFTADALEIAYVRKKFSLYGAILLDKDIRRLIAYFTKFIGLQSSRKFFRRLQQISQLINLDEVNDVYEIYENEIAAILSKGLSPNEIKRVLALRKDFLPTEIQKIHLD